MTPQAKAWQVIDQTLAQAGWVVQDMKLLNLLVAMGVAVSIRSERLDRSSSRAIPRLCIQKA